MTTMLNHVAEAIALATGGDNGTGNFIGATLAYAGSMMGRVR